MKIFIEFWKARDKWHQLSKQERIDYLGQIGPVIEDLISNGVTFEAWGVNEDNTPQKSDYDFFAVSKLPTQKLLDSFQSVVEASGWYEYFDQVNISGDNIAVESVIGKMIDL